MMSGDTNLGSVEPKEATGCCIQYDKDGEPVDVTDEAGKGSEEGPDK